MARIGTALLLAAISVLWPAARASAVNGTPTWTFSEVSASPGAGFHLSSPDLAFDHYGTPAVTWSRIDTLGLGPNQVYHSQETPLGLWSNRLMVSSNGAGVLTASSYDRSERPHVAWVNSDGVIGASFNGGTAQTLSSAPLAASSPAALSLRTDLAGNLVGAYAGASVGQIGSLAWSGTTYSRSLLTTVSGISQPSQAAITVDHRGLRQMILSARVQPSDTPSVIVASEPANNSAWVSGVLTSAESVAGVDIETNDSNGHVGLAYVVRNGATSQLYYAESNGSTLATTLVTSSNSVQYGDLSLAFDLSDGQPAIAFEDATSSSLLFATRGGTGTWSTSLVDSSISTMSPDGRPRVPSLAFNDYGTGWPAIAYIDADGSLRVAFDPPGVPEPGTLFLLAVGLGATGRLVRSRRRLASCPP